jgi:hypothetical protein
VAVAAGRGSQDQQWSSCRNKAIEFCFSVVYMAIWHGFYICTIWWYRSISEGKTIDRALPRAGGLDHEWPGP